MYVIFELEKKYVDCTDHDFAYKAISISGKKFKSLINPVTDLCTNCYKVQQQKLYILSPHWRFVY
jgi:hypothetical protein